MSTQLPYRPHTLRLQGLRALDQTAVQLFLKLAQQRLRQTWIVLDDTSPVEADVILAAPDVLPLRGHRVVWVTAPGQLAPNDGTASLTRPLQLEAFYEVLQTLKPAPSAAPIVLPLAAAAECAPPRYRLKRWPSSALLGQHAHSARLASFLSARYLSTTELAQLSHVPPEACSRFIHAMRQHDLVEVRIPETAPPALSARPPAAAPARAPAWLSRLRHKLQLTDTLAAIG